MGRYDLPGDRLPGVRGAGLTELPRSSPLFGLRVYFSDAHMVVLDKPVGVLMHRTHPRPQVSLHEMVRREWWGATERIDVVHRLDRDTSGLVVLGLNPAATRSLAGQFEHRRVRKRYLAIVQGEMAADGGVIDLPIGRAVGARVRKKQIINGERARPAHTRYRVLGRRRGMSLVAVMPRTGRLHQIRVHFKALGYPLVGDKLYGPDERWHLRFMTHGWTDAMARALPLARHALHADALTLRHPVTHAPLRFRSPLAGDMAHLWGEDDASIPCAGEG